MRIARMSVHIELEPTDKEVSVSIPIDQLYQDHKAEVRIHLINGEYIPVVMFPCSPTDDVMKFANVIQPTGVSRVEELESSIRNFAEHRTTKSMYDLFDTIPDLVDII